MTFEPKLYVLVHSIELGGSLVGKFGLWLVKGIYLAVGPPPLPCTHPNYSGSLIWMNVVHCLLHLFHPPGCVCQVLPQQPAPVPFRHQEACASLHQLLHQPAGRDFSYRVGHIRPAPAGPVISVWRPDIKSACLANCIAHSLRLISLLYHTYNTSPASITPLHSISEFSKSPTFFLIINSIW